MKSGFLSLTALLLCTSAVLAESSAAGGGDSAATSAAIDSPASNVPVNADDLMGSVFAFMMQYSKMMAGEARDDRKIARASRDAALRAKEEKLKLEQLKIDAAKKEAAERYDSASRAAGVRGDSGKPEGKAKKKPSDLPARRVKGETAATDDDDALLNAAACKAVAAKGRPLPRFCRTGIAYDPPMHLDRSEIDRVDQLGGGGFNPNKP